MKFDCCNFCTKSQEGMVYLNSPAAALASGLKAIDIRAKMSDHRSMKGSEFLKKIKELGRKNNVEVRLEHRRGKGSHATLFYGEKFTIIRALKDELKTENWNL